MLILFFIKKYWEPMIAALLGIMLFYGGWHLRAMHDSLNQYKEIDKQNITSEKASIKYEDYRAKWDEINQDLNHQIKVIHEVNNNDSCVLTAGELHYIKTAD